jgi:hypothetical protein
MRRIVKRFIPTAPKAMSTTLFWGKHWKWVRLIDEARRAPKLADWLVGYMMWRFILIKDK